MMIVMDTSDVGLALVVNLESTGPSYVLDTGLSFMNPASQMLFASRVVILCGMANHRTPTLQLQGPVPISEVEGKNLEFYFFQVRPSNPEMVNLHIIMVVIFPITWKQAIRKLEVQLESKLRALAEKIDFSTMTPLSLSEEFKSVMQQELTKIRNFLTSELPNAPIGEKSLFNLGFLVTLPNDLQKAGKQLILHPEGIKKGEFSFEENVLEDLIRYGLVKIENRDNEEWIIPI